MGWRWRAAGGDGAGDATLVVLSELFPRAKLSTVDDDFRRYRRLRNQAIMLEMPGVQ